MQSLSNWLHKYSNGYTILVAIILYAIFLGKVMPAQSIDSSRYTSHWGAPDRHLFFTPDQLYAEIQHWDEAGRRDYIDFRLSLDIVWAVAYTAFLISLTSVALRLAFPAHDPRRLLNSFALLPMLCDLAENALGILLVANFDTRVEPAAWLMTGMTTSKWVSLALAHGILLFAAGAAVLARWRISL